LDEASTLTMALVSIKKPPEDVFSISFFKLAIFF
jgi:hypothetical protein